MFLDRKREVVFVLDGKCENVRYFREDYAIFGLNLAGVLRCWLEVTRVLFDFLMNKLVYLGWITLVTEKKNSI